SDSPSAKRFVRGVQRAAADRSAHAGESRSRADRQIHAHARVLARRSLAIVAARVAVVRVGVAGAEAFAEFVTIEFAIAEIATVTIVGVAPFVVPIELERAALPGVLFTRLHAFAKAVVVSDAFDLATGTAAVVRPIAAVDVRSRRTRGRDAEHADERQCGEPSRCD